MIEISPEVQALIDRLARMDPANPRHDKAAIERAINAHLAALGLPSRPLVWVDDVKAGYALVMKRVGLDWNAAEDAAWIAASGAAEDAARVAASGTDWSAVEIATENAASIAARVEIWSVAKNAVLDAAWDAVGREDAGGIVEEAAWDAASIAAWGVAVASGLAAFRHPATARLAAIWLAMVDAYNAGLFLFWITPDEVICVPQPSLSIENGRLHCADGPAVAWPSGETCHYFWRGVQVAAWLIEAPNGITTKIIQTESNQEIRRCMIEIYGMRRYLRDSGARLVHQDAFGKLWEVQVGRRFWNIPWSRRTSLRIVEVENGTPEPDGMRRIYTLDVTNAEEVLGWPIKTARAAVAATYGLKPEEYHPDLRT